MYAGPIVKVKECPDSMWTPIFWTCSIQGWRWSAVLCFPVRVRPQGRSSLQPVRKCIERCRCLKEASLAAVQGAAFGVISTEAEQRVNGRTCWSLTYSLCREKLPKRIVSGMLRLIHIRVYVCIAFLKEEETVILNISCVEFCSLQSAFIHSISLAITFSG